MRRKITVYGLRFSKTTFWNHINTGFLDPAVATALTACGIETSAARDQKPDIFLVATALTACGIETMSLVGSRSLFSWSVATALTVCGIETMAMLFSNY